MSNHGKILSVCLLVFETVTAVCAEDRIKNTPSAARLSISYDTSARVEGIDIVADERGPAGSFARLTDTNLHPILVLDPPVTGAMTAMLWVRPHEFIFEGQDGFSDRSPMTVLQLLDDDSEDSILLRIHDRKLQLLYTFDGERQVLFSPSKLELKQWTHLAVVMRADAIQLYIDGRLDAATAARAPSADFETLKIGRYAGRRFLLGDVDEVRLYDQALPLRALRDLIVDQAGPRRWDSDITEAPRGAECSYGNYPALKVKDDVLHPMAVGFGPAVAVVPWSGKGARDLILGGVGTGFGTRLALYRELGRDPESPAAMPSKPYYDPGRTLDLKGAHFRAIYERDGLFDLVARGDRSVYTNDNLIYYRNLGQVGQPEFALPEAVLIGDGSFKAAFSDSVVGWTLADVDGDGTDDLLVMTVSGNKFSYFPDGINMWNNQPHANSGFLRGYDIAGNWLGSRCTHRLFWARGMSKDGDKPHFAEPRPVHHRVSDFQVQLKCFARMSSPGYVVLDGKPFLLIYGEVDRIWALPTQMRDGELFCGEAVNLLARDAAVRDVYVHANIETADLDGDGAPEVLLCGNPGRVTVLKGSAAGQFVEMGSLRCRGGLIETDTLVSPVRIDWDGDGMEDVICGDSSGLLTFWPGMTEAMYYGSPRWFESNGKRIHHQAGPTGSFQGPVESRWGYIHPTVGDWDEDGDLDIITSDINAVITFYERRGDMFDLTRRTFAAGGEEFFSAWRLRPGILPSTYNFRQSESPCLLYTDMDGELAVGIPAAVGATEIAESVKLHYVDGEAVTVSGIRGQWGRTKIAICDWDLDGRWDILWGTSGGVQRWALFQDETYYSAEYRVTGAMPFFLRNVGTNAEPVFEREKIIRFKNGDLIDVHVHNASVWPTDMDGDGLPDLIIGAEDGRVYAFMREQLTWPD